MAFNVVGNEGARLTMDLIEKERLRQFIELEAELQQYQSQNTMISAEVLLEFIWLDERGQIEKIQRLENWLNTSWRRGERPSRVPYAELMQRIKRASSTPTSPKQVEE